MTVQMLLLGTMMTQLNVTMVLVVGALDECGVCNGPGAIYECGCADIPEGDCDCDGNQLDDAVGVCGGSGMSRRRL